MDNLLEHIDLSIEIMLFGIAAAFIIGILIGHFTVNDMFDDDDKRNTKPRRFAYRAGCALLTVSMLLMGTINLVPAISTDVSTIATFLAGGLLVTLAIAS